MALKVLFMYDCMEPTSSIFYISSFTPTIDDGTEPDIQSSGFFSVAAIWALSRFPCSGRRRVRRMILELQN